MLLRTVPSRAFQSTGSHVKELMIASGGHTIRSFPWRAIILASIVLLGGRDDARAKGATPRKPVDSDEDGDSEATEAEGPERIIERLRWFRQGRLGRDGEISPDARNRALRQLDENIQNGISLDQHLARSRADQFALTTAAVPS